METKEKKWEGKTGGGQFGQKFLLHFLKHVHVRFLYPILYLVIPFTLFSHQKDEMPPITIFVKDNTFLSLSPHGVRFEII